MRIFTAGVATETNTFAPWPTGRQGFEEEGIFHGDATTVSPGGNAAVLRQFRDLAVADGHEFVEGLFAFAQPSGPTLQNLYEEFRDEIVSAVVNKGPFDVILLFLHGAMVATQCDDCEGDICASVREVAGPNAKIGVELDPHCHLTPLMLDKADAIVISKEYPHVDFVDRARELYALCTKAALGKVRPVMRMFDCRMVGFYPTTKEPMQGLVARAHALEREPGILSVSIAHGFPWGDTPETGTKVLAIADGDAALASRTAASLGKEIYARRNELLPRFPGIESALDQAAAARGVVVIADTADNAGGGAPGDNTALLRAMLKRGLSKAVLGGIWDPMAALKCAEAGVGSRFFLRLGGKSGPASGDPLDVEVLVKALREDHDQADLGGDGRTRMGLSAWLDIQGIDVLVQSVRTQIFAPDAFTGVGISLEDKHIIAVKSSHHYHARFAPLADVIIPTATPGAIQMDFAAIPYVRKKDLNFFPRAADPLALD